MATRLTKIVADFQTSLATILAVGATSATLVSATDDDSVALPSGSYFFTIDVDNSNKEHIVCDLSGASISNIKSVSRQGVQTAGIVRVHRVGAQVVLTDFAIIKELTNLLDGTVALDGSHPLIYDSDPAITDGKHLATKKYFDDIVTAGGLKAATGVIGIAKLSYAPDNALIPIAVGDNDPRVPTSGQKAALAGTGTPSGSNKYVTETDPNIAGTVKLSGDQTVNGVKTFGSNPILPAVDATTANQAVRKAQVDALMAFTDTTTVTDGALTFTYQKVGKYYFNILKSNDNSIGNDATSRARLCTVLGITEASHGSSTHYRVVSGPLGVVYNGSSWSAWDTPGADMPTISWIKST